MIYAIYISAWLVDLIFNLTSKFDANLLKLVDMAKKSANSGEREVM